MIAEVQIKKGHSPLKAIRVACLECASGRTGVRKCDNAKCALHAFRFGKNPRRQGIGRPGGNPGVNHAVR